MQFKVSIPVRGGCAGTGVRLGNATVRGNVADEARAPVPNADVFLFYALDGQYHPENALKTRTDANGRFTFSRVEAAKFILSAQYGGSRKMIFFPGTEDNSKANPSRSSLAGRNRILRCLFPRIAVEKRKVVRTSVLLPNQIIEGTTTPFLSPNPGSLPFAIRSRRC